MAYPILRLDGQYTLKRVLTLPNNTGTPMVAADIGGPVTMNAAGEVTAVGAGAAAFWGILRAVESDGYVSVDFSGVHKMVADAALDAGIAITINTGKVVAATNPDTGATAFATKAVSLSATTGTAGEEITVFILN